MRRDTLRHHDIACVVLTAHPCSLQPSQAGGLGGVTGAFGGRHARGARCDATEQHDRPLALQFVQAGQAPKLAAAALLGAPHGRWTGAIAMYARINDPAVTRGWHLELPVGGQGHDEDFTASGRPPVGG